MNKPIFRWAMVACACAPLATLAANGSIANAMVRDAALRRIELQQRADRAAACEKAQPQELRVCSSGAANPRERVKKT
jgi:hypothetical protein